MFHFCLYRRLGRDARTLELREDGTIGIGKADFELTWSFDRGQIRVFGKDGLTFKVTPGEGQVWSGFWETVEPAPVELIPDRQVQPDGRVSVRVRDSADFNILQEIERNYGYKLGIRWLPPFPTIIDVGAHIGIFTIYAKRVRPHARVIAIEPNAENVQVCAFNCQGLSQVHIEHAALYYGRAPKFTYVAHARMYVLGNDGSSLDVPTITLEQLAERYHLEDVHFLKLDCEGSEFNILEYGEPWIRQHVHMIGGEYHLHYPLSQPWLSFIEQHYSDWICVRDTRFSGPGLGDFLLINPKSECAKYL